ncbi:MAG: FAD-dependent thymidylate synthase [Firmicutes bacterium]|nr:FAD-dependent thymidylate synthase [Bacillota bacterium]
MKLITSRVYLIDEPNPLKKIELAGRTCYKSDSEFTDESAIKFFEGMAKRHHFAMLEHGECTFEISGMNKGELDGTFRSIPFIRSSYKHGRYYITMSFSHMTSDLVLSYPISKIAKELFFRMRDICINYYLNGMNDKVLVDNTVGVQIKMLKDVREIVDFGADDLYTHKSFTFKFICDRGVSHELVRHRCSVAQESQRYCNYGKDKFGNEITFVAPHDWEEWTEEQKEMFAKSLAYAEKNYLDLLNSGKAPQQARAVLPNATKTEVILTMPVGRWLHFLNLRSIGTTGAPHPDMKKLADQVNVTVHDLIDQYLNK